jgi:hypothetical protein
MKKSIKKQIKDFKLFLEFCDFATKRLKKLSRKKLTKKDIPKLIELTKNKKLE